MSVRAKHSLDTTLWAAHEDFVKVRLDIESPKTDGSSSQGIRLAGKSVAAFLITIIML